MENTAVAWILVRIMTLSFTRFMIILTCVFPLVFQPQDIWIVNAATFEWLYSWPEQIMIHCAKKNILMTSHTKQTQLKWYNTNAITPLCHVLHYCSLQSTKWCSISKMQLNMQQQHKLIFAQMQVFVFKMAMIGVRSNCRGHPYSKTATVIRLSTPAPILLHMWVSWCFC
jgi:hypothetical protein